jgi:hypothetical protein
MHDKDRKKKIEAKSKKCILFVKKCLDNRRCLEAAEMRCLRSVNPLNAQLNPIFHLLTLLGAHHIFHISRIRVKGYTKLDKIRSEALGNKLEMSGIQDVRSKHKTGSIVLKEWTTPDFRNTPSTTNIKGEEIVNAPGKDGNASMPEQVKRPNQWRKTMMMNKQFGLLA